MDNEKPECPPDTDNHHGGAPTRASVKQADRIIALLESIDRRLAQSAKASYFVNK